jgi:hypothetical protein
VVDRELELQEREEQGDLSLSRELEAITTHESDLSSHATTLAMEWKDLEETRAGVLARELTSDIRDVRLNSKDEELADREKRLVEMQLQELATTHRRLEELQAARTGEDRSCAGAPRLQSPMGLEIRWKRSVLCSHCLTPLGPRSCSCRRSSVDSQRQRVVLWPRQW